MVDDTVDEIRANDSADGFESDIGSARHPTRFQHPRRLQGGPWALEKAVAWEV
jgi:hypothetical protein